MLLLHGLSPVRLWARCFRWWPAAGMGAIAPDFPGRDSPPDPPGTWSRQVEAVERLHSSLGLRPITLVVHDWAGLIGLALGPASTRR